MPGVALEGEDPDSIVSVPIWRSPSKHLAASGCGLRHLLGGCSPGCGRRLSPLVPRRASDPRPGRAAPVHPRRATAGHLCEGLPFPDLLRAAFVYPSPGRAPAVYLGRKHGELRGLPLQAAGQGLGRQPGSGGKGGRPPIAATRPASARFIPVSLTCG